MKDQRLNTEIIWACIKRSCKRLKQKTIHRIKPRSVKPNSKSNRNAKQINTREIPRLSHNQRRRTTETERKIRRQERRKGGGEILGGGGSGGGPRGGRGRKR